MIRVAVLASTNGTDMDALLGKNEHFELALVLCNKECGALEKAKQHDIPAELVISKGKTREAYDEEVSKTLKKHKIELIVLIGYMRFLSKPFVEEWQNKIMNIHPSLLPAFPGGMDLNVHEAVLERGCKVTGCTLHFVDEGADTGPIIMQQPVPVAEDETPETLKEKVQDAEKEIIRNGVELFAQRKLRIINNKTMITPPVAEKHVVPTSAMNDRELKEILEKNGLSLTIGEVRMIEEKLKRDPTLTELHIFNIEWSEHCSYKSSKNILTTLPTEAPNVILGPSEDAGIVEFAEVNGEMYGIALRQESHNHPSQIVPYEGAATGIGGIVRDILCMGAKVIGTIDPLRFGNPDSNKTKYIANTVIDGIAGYGNAIGVPNIAGDVYFNDSYEENCLVNVACIGIVKESEIVHSHAPKNCAGYDVILVGKPTDNSGFGGATFASIIMDEDANNKGAVQVPDPFLKNVMIRATYDVFKRLREENVHAGFKDCGAGGVMCATSELGAGGNVGVTIDVDKIPVSMELPPFITACSETQERLVWMVPKAFTPHVLKIYNEDFELPVVAEGARATVIGEVTEEPDYVLRYNNEIICNAPIQEVTAGITYDREMKAPPRNFTEPNLPEPTEYDKLLLRVLGHPNVANKARAYKHYDTEVQGMAVIRPGEADAGVIKPLVDSPAGLAVSSDCNPMHGRINPYHCAVNAVTECMRNLAAVGATPAGFTNCLNFGSPENPEVLWDFSEAVRGLKDACTKLSHKIHGGAVPIVSGNVSFYNENATGSAIDPSPHVTGVGILRDYTKAITMQLKQQGTILCMIGERKDELGGSVYYQLHDHVGKNLPVVDFERAKNEIHTVIDIIQEGLCLSCHDISDGGLAATLAEMLLGPNGNGTIGVNITMEDRLRTDKLLFSETGGFVLEIPREHLAACKECCEENNVTLHEIGTTTYNPALTFTHNRKTVLSTPIASMARAWLTGFEEALQ